MRLSNRWDVFARGAMTLDNSRTLENQTKSPLLRLPAELRNKIYAYAFESATVRKANGAAALLLTCRQLHYETKLFKIFAAEIPTPSTDETSEVREKRPWNRRSRKRAILQTEDVEFRHASLYHVQITEFKKWASIKYKASEGVAATSQKR